MKILVTGGAGFIGSHIVDKLIEQNHDLIIVDNLTTGTIHHVNPKAEFFQLDICSPDLGKAFQSGVDMVVHLAAQLDVNKSVKDPLFDAQVNILGTLNLLENCKNYNVKKIIYAGSAAEIGEPQYLPIDEKHPLNPISPYGASKISMGDYIKVYSRLYGINYTCLRYSNVYGPRQGLVGEGGVIAIFSKQLIKNNPLTVFGDGEQTRDMIYVEDVAAATTLMLEKGNNKTYNLGTGEEISINQLIELMKTIVGKEVKVNYSEPRSGDIKKNYYSIEKIKSECAFSPQVNIREGLTKTINYFQSQKEN